MGDVLPRGEATSDLRGLASARMSASKLIIMPVNETLNKLAARFDDNYWSNDESYAKYYYYPTGESNLRAWIETTYQSRSTRAHLIYNRTTLRYRNGNR